MVSVKPLSDIVVAPDGCFAFVDKSTNVSINYESPDGSIEYTDFDAYEHEDGTILRFNSASIDGPTPWSLNVVLDDTTTLLQWSTYEDDVDAWESIDRTPHRFFSFMKSVDVGLVSSSRTFMDPSVRCDNRGYGPIAYSHLDGIKTTPMDPHFARMVVTGPTTKPILSLNGTCHITSMYAHGINQSWRNWPMVILTGRTLSGIVKQLSEWKNLYQVAISQDDFAEHASVFLNALGITEEMISELEELEVMMPTERFFRGYGDPRHGFTETGILPVSMRSQLMKNIRYKTLSVLEAKHPGNPTISEDLKNQERQTEMTRIMKWFYMFKPDVILEDMTTDLIYKDIYNRSQDRTAVVPVPANAQIYANGVYAARFFDAIK